ncbi:MAG: hypothetical protein R2780_09785 [Crocinitomicaceae bacterium]|nr:hypothetical protein [Crocinitomicaceae bacterium]
MKRFFLCAIAATFLLTACGGSGEEGDNTQNDQSTDTLDYSGMTEMSLKDQGLNIKFMLPEVASSTGASIEPLVEHDDGDYLWHVKIGTRFHLIIEDYGKEKDKVANEKARLGDLNKIFVVEYLVDEPNLIMYKRTLHEEQGGQPSYHCYGETVIDGYTYVLRSQEDGNLKPIIDDMVKTIRSAKPLEAAAS